MIEENVKSRKKMRETLSRYSHNLGYPRSTWMSSSYLVRGYHALCMDIDEKGRFPPSGHGRARAARFEDDLRRPSERGQEQHCLSSREPSCRKSTTPTLDSLAKFTRGRAVKLTGIEIPSMKSPAAGLGSPVTSLANKSEFPST